MKVNLGDRSYDIVVEDGGLRSAGEQAGQRVRGRSAAIVTNEVVGPLYAETLKATLENAGFRTIVLTVPDGEDQKTLQNAGWLCEELVRARLDRDSCVFALGGGVIGDLAGFVAAIYLRGVDFVQAPTSLLAQVDSSVGGKTAVNLPQGKNLVGAFHQPRLVIVDPLTLRTLPARELRGGLAEIIKHGIIRSQELFEFLEKNIHHILALDTRILASVIKDSCLIKAEVVAEDERESGLRAILNCGHTVGHAVESVAGYGRYRHGEAVAVGLAVESLIAERAGLAENGMTERIVNLLERTGLPTKAVPEISTEAVLEAISVDKKVSRGKVRFVLPVSIGRVIITDNITDDDVAAAFELCKET